jgi:hypothetical protein
MRNNRLQHQTLGQVGCGIKSLITADLLPYIDPHKPCGGFQRAIKTDLY